MGVIVGVEVNVGVEVIVGVKEGASVKVAVLVGVSVSVDVAVQATAVMVACSSIDGPQAVNKNAMLKMTIRFFMITFPILVVRFKARYTLATDNRTMDSVSG